MLSLATSTDRHVEVPSTGIVDEPLLFLCIISDKHWNEVGIDLFIDKNVSDIMTFV